ncbi:hypothetical protein SAMN05216353_12528 [Halobacillus alkaliphilus]|uniref:DUF3953 domain-containing protein n=1 Tax=Halobacillus alkaliphilus TaxID=396056 RepID=A0A1I2PJ34_9BACI|nr:hypothetical protein [Halobacillus alkaliphilus]SFG15109.1 hypothetical protein SAMN05216353_12528 [Halobacillus alkaliphilus]
MLRVIRVSLAIIILFLSSYGLLTDESAYLLPYLMMLLASFSLVMALEEFRKTRNSLMGYLLIGTSLLCLSTVVGPF